jgi:hypothetical protein
MWMRLRFRDKKPPSRLERRFLLYWRSFGGPELEREFRFHMDRKWRGDLATGGHLHITRWTPLVWCAGRAPCDCDIQTSQTGRIF